MERITSFSVDHTQLRKGIYVSRVDDNMVTYDIRMCEPNVDPVLDPKAAHTIEHIGATFIGSASTRNFVTTGIYEDFEITENEYAYVKELIILLDKISKNIAGSNTKDDLSILNLNFEDMHEQLYDIENSPYRFIKKQPQNNEQ